ncbi:hypothetical protein SAMN05421736_101732 [Evansella caseinilytica]|uniref:Uncharacterized protein n=1 Tax=Evansella caseinilytica TaxID=1503961 RepID=A0A1H3I6I2_9BACI|nr:hypothetical protein [Evansella caseinilytica]SDY23313.1 hypothetical protein SAMN05421736_101732 [Evansella caseinilytica]
MNRSGLINKIADKHVNIAYFAETVRNDENIRAEVIRQLLTNNNIMVYYHCYYIISRASEEEPELFYEYWDDFAALLDHHNSYHRDIGLTLIANLTKIDEKDLFSGLYDKYIQHFNDAKFMTAQCFLQNIKKIVMHKKQYIEDIVKLLVEADNRCHYPKKQKELLKSDIIDVFAVVYRCTINKGIVEEFITAQRNSLSPKTRKKAKSLINKYGL